MALPWGLVLGDLLDFQLFKEFLNTTMPSAGESIDLLIEVLKTDPKMAQDCIITHMSEGNLLVLSKIDEIRLSYTSIILGILYYHCLNSEHLKETVLKPFITHVKNITKSIEKVSPLSEVIH